MTDTSLHEGIDEVRSWAPSEVFQQRIQDEINDVKVQSAISMTVFFFFTDVTSEGNDSIYEAAGI